MVSEKTKKRSIKEILPWVLVIGGMIGVLAAGILTVEKFHLLQNPGEALSCDINPIVACGSVIGTDQASAFGFPNPMIGLVGFAVVTTIGMGMLAGATFKRWFWLGLQFGTIFGIIFVHWLIFQSLYRINALCPYCMIVWSVVIPIFVFTTSYNLNQKNIKLSKTFKPASEFIQKFSAEIVLVWYIIIIGLILNKFWYFWSTLV